MCLVLKKKAQKNPHSQALPDVMRSPFLKCTLALCSCSSLPQHLHSLSVGLTSHRAASFFLNGNQKPAQRCLVKIDIVTTYSYEMGGTEKADNHLALSWHRYGIGRYQILIWLAIWSDSLTKEQNQSYKMHTFDFLHPLLEASLMKFHSKRYYVIDLNNFLVLKASWEREEERVSERAREGVLFLATAIPQISQTHCRTTPEQCQNEFISSISDLEQLESCICLLPKV